MLAPASRAPEASDTVPTTRPESDCAMSEKGTNTKSNNARTIPESTNRLFPTWCCIKGPLLQKRTQRRLNCLRRAAGRGLRNGGYSAFAHYVLAAANIERCCTGRRRYAPGKTTVILQVD